jgi:hypothetical protein
MEHDLPPDIAEPAPGGRSGLAAAWRLIAPGLGYVLLAAAALLGLFAASGAADGEAYAVGLATFALAALIIGWRLKDQFDGKDDGLLLPVTVASEDALFLLIAVMTVLGLAGLLVAAEAEGAFHAAGIALFCVAALLIFLNIKAYFDRREGGGPPA